MSLRLRLTAVCTIAAALYAGNASAHPLNQHETPVAAPLVHLIVWHRSQTWHYQDLLASAKDAELVRRTENRVDRVQVVAGRAVA